MQRRALLSAGLLGSLPLLPGCATLVGPGAPQAASLRAHPPADLPPQVNLADTPFHPQTALQCGPAVLATLLGAAGRPVSPEALTPAVFVPERGGSLQLEMLAAGRRHDAVATRLPPRLEAVLREVAAGHPVGVLLNLSLPIVPLWHYAVVVGYDLPAGEVLLRSGETREARMTLTTFEYTWARSQHWAFVALPHDTLPATSEVAATRDALLGFSRVAPTERTVVAWRTAAARWPDDTVIGMGLGNSLVAQGDLAAAEAAFAQLAARTDSAAAWNNLAGVRLQRGNPTGAREAARQAVRRATEAEPVWLDAARATAAQAEAAR